MGSSLKKNLATVTFLAIILLIISGFIVVTTWLNQWVKEKDFIKIVYQSPIQLIPSLELNSLKGNYAGQSIYNLDYQEFKDKLLNIFKRESFFEEYSNQPSFFIRKNADSVIPVKYIKLIRKEPNTLIIKPIFFPIYAYIQLEKRRRVLVFLTKSKSLAFLGLRGKIPKEYKNVSLIKLSRYHKVTEESIKDLLFDDFFQRNLLTIKKVKSYLNSREFKDKYSQDLLNVFDIKHIEFYKNQFIHFFVKENKFYNLLKDCQIILDTDKLKISLQKALIYIEKLKKEDLQTKKIIKIDSTLKNRAKVSYQ